MVEVRTKLINNVRGWLRGQLWRIRSDATAAHDKANATAYGTSSSDRRGRMCGCLVGDG